MCMEITSGEDECVGHIQTRMGSRLRNLRARYGGRKLADKKTINGRGRLTEERVKSIQQYNGNAIRGNKGDLKAMSSTDALPVHNSCNDCWCPYKKAKTKGTLDTYRHKNNSPAAFKDEIKSIFKD